MIQEEWFKKVNKITNLESIFLLAIFELEALILADINSFNKMYGTNLKFKKNPLFQSNPKEFLIDKTLKSKRTYQENQTPEIFEQLDFETVYKNHIGIHSFQKFVNDLTAKFK